MKTTTTVEESSMVKIKEFLKKKNKKHDEIMTTLFDISRPTYYKWKREKRPIAVFIEKYFSDDEILEFLEFGSLEQLDICKNKAPEFFKKISSKVNELEKRIAVLENR